VPEALRYLARAEAWDSLADVILRCGPELLTRGQSGIVAQWASMVPAKVANARPSVLLLEAADRLSGTPTAAVGSSLRRLQAQRTLSEANQVAVHGLLAQWLLESGDLRAAMVSADVFLEQEDRLVDVAADDLLGLGDLRDLLRGSAHLVRATALIELGDLTGARDALAPAFTRSVPLVDVHGLGIAAVIAVRGGRLRLASRTAARALDLADEFGLAHHRTLAAPLLALAQVARERNDLAEAAHLLQLALRSAGGSSFVAKLIDLERAEQELAAGSFDEAQALTTLNRDDWAGECPSVAVRIRGIEAQLAFVFGGPDQAAASLDRSPAVAGLEVAKERVRIALASGDFAGARRVLADWPEQPAPRARLLRALWTAAVAHATDGESVDQAALSRTVIELEQEGQVGLFADVGAPLTVPLRRLHRAAPSPFLRRVLAHPRLASGAGDRPVKPLAETLTAQEMTVLGYLPSWISNAGIAERLGVSLNTIKTHMKHIYRKLGVADRREAVEVARSLGLL
jgi:LuxR family maltose regulon positive regulatory protein